MLSIFLLLSVGRRFIKVFYFVSFLMPHCQYPDYSDAYLRLAALSKARNDIQQSFDLVSHVLHMYAIDRGGLCFVTVVCFVW